MSHCAPFELAKTPLWPGASLIEASAGTGKTYAITGLVARLIVEQNLSIRDILVVTFTDAATQELRDRIRQTLGLAAQAFSRGSSTVPFLSELLDAWRAQQQEMAARFQNALCSFDEAPICTIHSFCQRTLQERAFDSGLLFDTELVTDPSELLRELADDFWRTRFYDAAPVLVQYAFKNALDPEVFMRLLRTCTNYPHLEFLSQAQGQSLDALAQQLEGRFQEARALWQAERGVIQACFGSAIKWGNKPYNSDADMAALYEELDVCFSESKTAFETFSSLEQFCPTALEAKRSQRSKSPPPIPTHSFFETCEKLCAAEKLWLASLSLAFVEHARLEMPKRKAAHKIQFYEDLLTRLDQALAGPSGVSLVEHLRTRYKAALIDEFQDTDPIQYAIFRRAFAGSQAFLFMIGDPKQAIYGFRGADIFTYLQAASETTRCFTLGANWRSESGLVQAVNRVFSFKPNAFVFDRIDFQATVAKGQADSAPLEFEGVKKAPFQLWFWETGKEITQKLARATLPGAVATEIVQLLNGKAMIGQRPVQPGDIAVLVLTNAQAAQIQEALHARRIPNVLYTTASLFDSVDAAELGRVLAGIAAPGNEQRVRSALATDLFGIDGASLYALDESQWQAWFEKFHNYRQTWEEFGFFRMFRQWLRLEQVRARLLGLANGERRLTNLLHLSEVLHHAESTRRLGINGLLKWLEDQAGADKEAPEEHQLRLERDDNAARIVTVHKSKGLEYLIVFCPFSWKGSEIKRGSDEQVFFHDPEHEGRLMRDLGPEIREEHRQLAKQEKLAENVRLLYVALTRAKHRCYFTWGRFRGSGSAAPSWLLHRSETLDGPVVASLEASFNALQDDDLRNHLEIMAGQSQGTIELSNLPEINPRAYQGAAQADAQLEARQFSGRIRRDWVISSFTGLAAGQHQEAPDHDAAGPLLDNPGTGIFSFPRGTKAGTCLHEILEKLDFASDELAVAALVQQRLEAHHFDQPDAARAVCQMLKNLVQFPLAASGPELKLAMISAADRLVELEFYFPIQQLVPSELLKLLSRHGWGGVAAEAGRFGLDLVNGYLNGYIDLVFQSDGRYYIVDWKSNWLGDSLEDYAQPALRTEMERQQYYLQYHLYTVALDKYLSLRMPGYAYDRHFGGVFYIFLRGIDPARPDCGSFYDRPSARAIHDLARLLADQ